MAAQTGDHEMEFWENKEVLSREEVNALMLDNATEILLESLNIIETTKNPDTYFMRYVLVLKKAYFLKQFVSGPIYKGMSPEQIYRTYSERMEMMRLHERFIDKVFAYGRESRFKDHFSKLRGYITKDAWEYYQKCLLRNTVTITGLKHYNGNQTIRRGAKIKLIKEPDNPYDSDAIRAEITEGEKIGYVANNSNTIMGNSISATALNSTIDRDVTATVLYATESCLFCELEKALQCIYLSENDSLTVRNGRLELKVNERRSVFERVEVDLIYIATTERAFVNDDVLLVIKLHNDPYICLPSTHACFETLVFHELKQLFKIDYMNALSAMANEEAGNYWIYAKQTASMQQEEGER